jgi:hypothetical protein
MRFVQVGGVYVNPEHVVSIIQRGEGVDVHLLAGPPIFLRVATAVEVARHLVPP